MHPQTQCTVCLESFESLGRKSIAPAMLMMDERSLCCIKRRMSSVDLLEIVKLMGLEFLFVCLFVGWFSPVYACYGCGLTGRDQRKDIPTGL